MKAKPFIQNSLQLDPDANQNLKSAIWIRLSERLLSCHLTYFALPDRVALAHKETVHLFKCKFSLHVQPPEQIENLVRKQYDEKNFSRIKKADGGEKIKILNNFLIKIRKKICQFVLCTNPPPQKKKNLGALLFHLISWTLFHLISWTVYLPTERIPGENPRLGEWLQHAGLGGAVLHVVGNIPRKTWTIVKREHLLFCEIFLALTQSNLITQQG